MLQLPSLDGSTMETLVRVILGEVALDLRAPGNDKLLKGAETLGLVPRQRLCLASLLDQVSWTHHGGWKSRYF